MTDSPEMAQLCELVKQLHGEQKKAFEDGCKACEKSQSRGRDQSKWHELIRDMVFWIGNSNPPGKPDRPSGECIAFALGWYFQHTEATRS